MTAPALDMERSIAGFVIACRMCIRTEQEKPSPDNALIGVLCDALRLARESGRFGKQMEQTP